MFITAKHNFLHTENGKTKLNKTTAKNRLNLKLDEDGIIRCYGRMTNTNLPQETITPILLPWKEKFIELMIEECHERLLHAGVSHTFLKSGQNIGLYIEVRNVLRKCRICRKYQGGPFKMPPMPPWPKNKFSTISTFQAHSVRLLWTPVSNIAESREEKGMVLLIHLRSCEGCPPRNCRRPNSRGILVAITKIYCKSGKS